ncbi:MAG: FecR family protein, partial [Flavobacteriales bacterium]
MQHRKKLTETFRRLFRKNADYQKKQLFARWFGNLDLSQGEIFKDQEEELRIKNKIEQNLYAHFFPSQQKTRTKLTPYWLPTAVAAMLTIVAGTIWLTNSPKKELQLVFDKTITRASEKKIITLSDGSTVTLNNESELEYPKKFSDSTREVHLKGEAFFEISKNKLKPFIVKTGQLNVKVLGTSFNVKHYQTDKNINVVVATGKVGVNAIGDKKIWLLNPGNKLTYHKTTAVGEQNNVNAADYSAWKRNELIFKDERLE